MSDAPDAPLAKLYAEFWREYYEHADPVTQRLLATLDQIDDLTTLNAEQWATLNEGMESYLRSPQFLRAMGKSIEALIQTGQATDSFSLRDTSRHPAGQETGAMWQRFVELADVASHHAVGATSFDVVWEQGTLRLLRFRNPDHVTSSKPVLICPSLVNRPYIVDLHADRSIVRQLLSQGLDVYLIDWGTPTIASKGLGLSDYVCRFMSDAVDATCRHAGASQVSLLGYCMGGTMSAMFASLYRERIRSLTLLASPIDFGGHESLLHLWTRAGNFDVDGLIDTFGNCPGWFLRTSFQQMKPIQNYVQKALTFRQNIGNNAFLENFFAIERWANDSVPVSGAAFREFIKSLYQENRLVRGEMCLCGEPVTLSRIDCPLLMLTADRDYLVPSRSTLALQRHVRSGEIRAMSVDAGHIGLAVGSTAHQDLWPAARRWIAEQATTSG